MDISGNALRQKLLARNSPLARNCLNIPADKIAAEDKDPPGFPLGSLNNQAPAVTCMAGVPNEIRTRVTAVKGRCPRPLDEGRMPGRRKAGRRDV